MKTVFTWLALLLIAWAAPGVQHLSIEGVKQLRLKPGASGQVVVEAKVREGFHIQANPASRPTLIETKVDITGSALLETGRAEYPPGKPYKVQGLGATVATYDGRFQVSVPVKAVASAKQGKQELEGRIRYQACDDKVCFPPAIAKFTAPVEVVP